MERTKKARFSGSVLLLIPLFWILVGLLFTTSFAEGADFPNREITIIVNLGPGGSRDISARGIGNFMRKSLGVPFVVMNLPGASGARGLEKVYTSKPDGYTIGIGGSSDLLQQVLQEQKFDYKKFTFIGKIDHSPTFFFVKSDSPFQSLKDLKTFGKPIRYSTHSLTASTAVAAMIFSEKEALPLVMVAGYKGGSAALLGLVRGEVEFSGPKPASAMPYVRAGQIRPIVTLDLKRSSHFPDTPTAEEAGFPELAALSSHMWIIAPPGLPKDRLKLLEATLMKTLKDPEYVKWAKGAALNPTPLSAQETAKWVGGQIEFFQKYKKYVEKYIEK